MTFDQKVQLWNAIGTWAAGLATLLAVLSALYLARRSEHVQRLAERRRNAAELYAVFSSAEMERVRGDAAAFLRGNNSAPCPLSFQQMHEGSTSASLAAVTRLVQFWERTANFLEADYVDPTLTSRFLRHYFESHFQNYLGKFIEISVSRPDSPAYLQWTVELTALARRWNVAATSSSHLPYPTASEA